MSPAPALAPPWTHHQVLALAEPFVRHGHRPHWPDCDRAAHRLVFAPREHCAVPAGPGGGDGPPAALDLRETLRLERTPTGALRLTRTLHAGADLVATLSAEGAEPATLLARMQAVPPRRQFEVGRSWRLARSGLLRGTAFQLTQACVETRALVVHLCMPRRWLTATASATLQLRARQAVHGLPEDLLAVLGWDWSLLRAEREGWKGSVRLRALPEGPARAAEQQLRRAAEHLAETLAAPPRRFHDRLRMARWGVFLRQSLPALACGALAVDAGLAGTLQAARDEASTLGLLLVPPALLLLYLLRSESPRLAMPAWPAPLRAPAWDAG